MAITTFNYSSADIDRGFRADWCFNATKSDDTYLEDPAATGKRVVSKAISIDRVDEAVTVEFAEKEPGQSRGRQHTFAAGELAAGVAHPMNIVKVLSTGTEAGVVVKIWV